MSWQYRRMHSTTTLTQGYNQSTQKNLPGEHWGGCHKDLQRLKVACAQTSLDDAATIAKLGSPLNIPHNGGVPCQIENGVEGHFPHILCKGRGRREEIMRD